MTFNHLDTTAMFWIAIIIIVFITSLFSWLERSSRYRAIEKMVEKGQTVPPDLFGRHSPPYDSRSWRYARPIASGIYLMCIGVALALFFWAVQGGGTVFVDGHVTNWLPMIGIFPFMIGFARVLAGLFERRPTNPGS